MTESVDSFFGKEASMMDGTMIDDLQQRLILVGDGDVEEVYQTISPTR